MLVKSNYNNVGLVGYVLDIFSRNKHNFFGKFIYYDK